MRKRRKRSCAAGNDLQQWFCGTEILFTENKLYWVRLLLVCTQIELETSGFQLRDDSICFRSYFLYNLPCFSLLLYNTYCRASAGVSAVEKLHKLLMNSHELNTSRFVLGGLCSIMLGQKVRSRYSIQVVSVGITNQSSRIIQLVEDV